MKITFQSKLSGVDFTKSGDFTNDKTGEVIKYGSSLKLKFNYEKEITKNGIPTKVSDTLSIKVPVQDEELESQVRRFNRLINTKLELDITNFENLTLSSFLEKVKELNKDIKIK